MHLAADAEPGACFGRNTPVSLDFVAIDFETANQKRGSVIQIGIAKVIDGQVTKKSSHFITPPPGLERFDRHSVAVHGLTARDVVGAATWPEILDRLIRFTGDLPLVAHSASVERSCIVQASEAHGIVAPKFRYYCSLAQAKKVYPKEASHSLGKLTKSVGLPDFDHHDAGADAEASGVLVLEMARLREATTLDQMPAGWIR
jgi:DNA polymerase-3 subunit epsilon